MSAFDTGLNQRSTRQLMKFHLPNILFKSLMAVVCVPGTTLASDMAGATSSENDTFLYVNASEVTSGDAASFAMAAVEEAAELRWNSTGDDAAVWDTEQTASWVDGSTGAGDATFTNGSLVVFGEGEELNKDVQIAEDGVAPSAVEISGSGYHFSGGDMVVTDSLVAEESATIDSVLVIGSASTSLDIHVAADKTLTASCIETFFTGSHEHHNYAHGSFVKSGAGTLRITQATHGSITAVTLQGGLVELGEGVSLDVGGNEIIGGTLENVQMLVTGDITRTLTGATVTAHNVIKSADGERAALLTDVALHAGTSTEYVTLQNVVFAGQSKLTGYITFEETHAQREMGVATGGSLSVENVTFELRGIAAGTKVLVVNGAVDDWDKGLLSGMKVPGNVGGLSGTISGWNTVKFVYSGVAVNNAAINSTVDGTVTLLDKHDGNLYWTGAQDSMWNPTSVNWMSPPDGDDQTGENVPSAFTALSNVHFGGVDVARHDILVMQDSVVMNLSVTEGGYSFSGARVAVLNDASFAPATGKVTFHDQLVVQGNLDTAGAGHVELLDATTVGLDAAIASAHTTLSGDITVGGTLSVEAGSDTTAGTLNISGNVTAQAITIDVSAGRREDVQTYDDELVSVSGNLSVGESGVITIGGTAKQYYRGVISAGELKINTQKHGVYFDHLHVSTLTVAEGAYVHVKTASPSITLSSSTFDVINLAGTLALDARGTTYDRGYEVRVQGDKAQLQFGSGCTIDNLSVIGCEDHDGYTNLSIVAQSANATVTHMEKLGNLSVNMGSLTIQEEADSETTSSGAVHGELTLDNAKMQLGAGADNFMAADSGAIVLKNSARLDVGSTTQALSANNKISLSVGSSINGAADGAGLQLADGAIITYANKGNAIKANLTATNELTLKTAQSGSVLNISGALRGSGVVQLTGPGKVALSGAQTFTGSVEVGLGSTLALQQAKTLGSAGVILEGGGTLALDTDTAVYLKSFSFGDGSTLSISTITGTDKFSTKNAALQVNSASGSGTLTVSFAEELYNLCTYNILTGLSSLEGITLSVLHKGSVLHASQYNVEFDAASGLLYMQTFMGNVWEGQGQGSSKIWSTSNTDGNWSGKSNYNEKTQYKTAIFGDVKADPQSLSVQGLVSPGEVYFVAETTSYTISSMEDAEGWGRLASGTKIHKEDDADVTLQLQGNADAATALGAVDIQAGNLILGSSLAVLGTDADIVTIEKGAYLVLNGSGVSEALVELQVGANPDDSFNYTASSIGASVNATLSGVTMDAAGIRGTEEAYGEATNLLINGHAHLSYLTLTDFEAKDNVTLSDVTLASTDKSQSHVLENVTIGEGVVVDSSAAYTLSGNIAFEDTLTNHGQLTLSVPYINVEIGKFKYDCTVDASDKTTYTYELISTEGTGASLSTGEVLFQTKQVFINGLNLDSGLASGIVAHFTDNGKGSFTLSIGKETADGTSDGSVGMPQWDERWCKQEIAPALSRQFIGKDAAATVGLAAVMETVTQEGSTQEGSTQEEERQYYLYGSVVADPGHVNDGKAIVATLSSVSRGELVAGSLVAGGDAVTTSDQEVWIYDSSGVSNIVGGMAYTSKPSTLIPWADAIHTQSGSTHILVNSTVEKDEVSPILNNWGTWEKEFVIAGSRWCNQTGESFVTVQQGEIYNVFGASCGGLYGDDGWNAPVVKVTQTGTSHVFVEGGRIGEIFAGGYWSTLIGTTAQENSDNKLAVEMRLSGGIIGGTESRVFGGSDHGYVDGDIYVCMDGDAQILSRLVGGSNAGTVIGNITLDLISGSAYRVDASGLGWEYEWEENGVLVRQEDHAYIDGDVLVNLYSAFELGIGADRDLACGIYGGMESTNYVEITKTDCTSTLHFAESDTYELGFLADDDYSSSDESIIVTGFDRFTLEEDAHVVLALGYFDIDMDPGKTLYIIGKGVVEVIGHGENFGRNIELREGATLKVSTSDIGLADDASDDRTISMTSGTTLDLTGYPVESGFVAATLSDGLSFKTEIAGDGVNNKGAIYKGTTHETADATELALDKVSLPHVTLKGNASAGVMDNEVLHMNSYGLGETTLDLATFTFTKQGLGAFVARHVQMTEGTVLVHQGDFYIDKKSGGAKTDMVLADGTSLYLNATGVKDATSLCVRTLSGAGSIELNNSPLTLQTTNDARYHAQYMNDAQSYSQFLDTTGFAYAVFSGVISDGNKASGGLIKDGAGVHYLSGSESTYTGGTSLKGGRLYLLGSSTVGDTFDKLTSTVAAGVIGTGAVMWSDAGSELYLSHNTRIYNNGTVSVDGGVMTIGVEASASGTLVNYVGLHSKGADGKLAYVKMGGEEYVEIDTHNLKSIAVNAKYADGTDYVAGSDINRNLMLLVSKAAWATAQSTTVTGLSDTRYNEAVFSGSLGDNEDMVASLHKVDAGILVMDQTNTYSGGTVISGGTLRLRGWATLGKNEKDNAVVQDTAGSTLMFTYNTGYGNEPSELANDITITGTGHDHWLGHAATDEQSAALISAVGPAVTFTLSGDIKGDGNVLHAGEGVLELSGDSSYTGGTYVSRGVVKVQSATGLGSTADGLGSVTVEADADLWFTVESGYTAPTMMTKLAADKNVIEGDVLIAGTETTERILHMDGNGYNAASTTLQQNGTFLLNGAAIDGLAVSAHSGKLTGDGAVVVSDASGSGASATFDTMIDYTGDFRVEGDRASIKVSTGSYTDGSISVAGNQASAQFGGDVTIVDGESLRLSSTGDAPGSSAAIITGGAVSVTSGAVFSVSNQETAYEYNLSTLQENVSLAVTEAVQMQTPAQNTRSDLSYTEMGNCHMLYDGAFDASLAVNNKVVGTVQAGGGLTLDGGATYETIGGHTSLLGGSLTLDTQENNLLTFHTTPDSLLTSITGDTQLVLFSEVGSVFFGLDGELAKADSGIYYTRADRYLTGCDYIDGHTLLVYDSHAAVVYLHTETIPEPATTTLSLLALASLVARRRRK